jgi:hypothetical protein
MALKVKAGEYGLIPNGLVMASYLSPALPPDFIRYFKADGFFQSH